ncbi:unnamed protein product [Prorocentrum cordatum]|uniref:Uncharacterized protein n=1 Tax=Prorocentrum cordatum TaxID=2364126 RepID=A0ABN9S4M5_9DINO|nr:unnamed protein product [Polarella glacialis]
MYRSLRPAALNMAAVPGLHLSTAKSQARPRGYKSFRPAPLDMALVPGVHHSTANGRWLSMPDEDAHACSPKHCDPKAVDDSVDTCSTAADGESLASFGEDVASDPCESDSEPSSPFASALLKRPEAREPLSPFSQMLQAKRQSAARQAAEPLSPFSMAQRQRALARCF